MQTFLDSLSWTELATKEEGANPLDKFEIAVLLDDNVVRHFPKRKLGRYARLSASFFRLTLRMSPQWLLWAKW